MKNIKDQKIKIKANKQISNFELKNIRNMNESYV